MNAKRFAIAVAVFAIALAITGVIVALIQL
jgi:hypothetical protein